MYKIFYYCLSQRIQKFVIFGGEINFLRRLTFFFESIFVFFQTLFNEAKTHPNNMDLNEYEETNKKCAVLPTPMLKIKYFFNL